MMARVRYLVLFSIHTIPGIALIETVLTVDPLYYNMGKLGLKSAVYNQERFQIKSGL